MRKPLLIIALATFGLFSCQSNEGSTTTTTSTSSADPRAASGQEGVQDDDSDPDIVKLAVSNSDLTTLVKAVEVAGLTTSLSNAGPFTVFAPVNAAFDKLPAGTVDALLKNTDELTDVLGHHTYVGVIKEEQLTDGLTLGMVDGKQITIKLVDGKPTVNGTANIVASVPAANGIVHVLDTVITD